MKEHLTKHPIISTVASAIILGTVSWLLSVDGFVTHQAYAADQDKLDHIIALIKTTDANQTYARQREALNATITDAERRIEELELYLEADPGSALTRARRANIRRLRNLKLAAERDRNALAERVKRMNRARGLSVGLP